MVCAASELEFFSILINAGSLSAAAGELDLTPPAVSKRLAQLEARLGVRLLNRSTRHFNITPEGELYLNRGKKIIQDIQEMEQEVLNLRAEPKGLLRIHTTPGFGRKYIASVITDFLKKYPDMNIHLILDSHQPDPNSGDFDIGIRFGLPPDSNIIARKIISNRRIVCASPIYLRQHSHPETPADLCDHNCIVLKQDETANSIWRFNKNNQNETIKVHGSLSSNDGEVVVNWALDGLGILMRAEWDVNKYIQSGRLVQLLADYELPSANVYVVYPERRYLSAKVRVFIDFLTEKYQEKASFTE